MTPEAPRSICILWLFQVSSALGLAPLHVIWGSPALSQPLPMLESGRGAAGGLLDLPHREEPSRAVRAPAPSPRPGPHGANPSCPRVSGRAELPQPGERVFVALGRWTIPAPTCRVPGTGVRAGALQLGMPRDTWECWGSARAGLRRGARCGRADGGHRAWLRQQCHLVARPLPARLAAFPCSRRREGGVPQSARLGTFLD